MEYLISLGVDPNSMNDTGRTPLWRASFNGHVDAVKLLLESGGDPDCRDNSSLESAYDVAKTDEIRELIVSLIVNIFIFFNKINKYELLGKMGQKINC